MYLGVGPLCSRAGRPGPLPHCPKGPGLGQFSGSVLALHVWRPSSRPRASPPTASAHVPPSASAPTRRPTGSTRCAASSSATCAGGACSATPSGRLHALHDDLEGQLAAAQQQGEDIRDPTLLDHLPVAEVDLEGMPDEVSRRLFEALRLEIRYDPAARTVRCSVTLIGETIDAVSRITQEAMTYRSDRPTIRYGTKMSDGSDGLCSAPRRIRTFAPGSGGQCSIP